MYDWAAASGELRRHIVQAGLYTSVSSYGATWLARIVLWPRPWLPRLGGGGAGAGGEFARHTSSGANELVFQWPPRCCMRRAGVARVVLTGPRLPPHLHHLAQAERLAELARAFPDQNSWLLRLGANFRVDSIGGLMSRLQDDSEPELFTMRLCLYCGGGNNAGRIFPSPTELGARLRSYRAQHGIVPAPAVLLGAPGWDCSAPEPVG